MWFMSEISLPLLGTLRLRFFPRVVGRVVGGVVGGVLGRGKPEPDAAMASQVALQAASAIEEYARNHAALFEREERLRAKAERLARAGTPSESADNRAERARTEVEAGLLALRERFAPSAGERRRVFDHEAGRLYPRLAVPNA
jgi:hypothetical protein